MDSGEVGGGSLWKMYSDITFTPPHLPTVYTLKPHAFKYINIINVKLHTVVMCKSSPSPTLNALYV